MSSQYEFCFVVFEEVLNPIWSKLHNISGSIWITDEIGLDAKILVTICRIRPEDINYKLLFWSGDFMDNFQRSLNLLDLIKAKQGASDASMKADDFVIDHCS